MSGFGEMHVRRGGYIGVAPLPGGLANACVVTADRRGRWPGPRRCWRTRSAATRCSPTASREPGG